MPYLELIKWIEFFKRRPVGWREDQRTALLLKAQGVKASETEMFPSLRMIKEHEIQKQENDKAVPKGRILELMSKAKSEKNSAKLDLKSKRIIANESEP